MRLLLAADGEAPGAREPLLAEPAIREGGNVADGFVHTVHQDGRWRNFIEGEQDWLRGAFRSKETAVVAGGRRSPPPTDSTRDSRQRRQGHRTELVQRQPRR